MGSLEVGIGSREDKSVDDLYKQRSLLYINLCLRNKKESRWKKDSSTPGWFVLYLDLKGGQVSFHIPNTFLFLVKDSIEETTEEIFDGHTSEDVFMLLIHQASKL